MLRVWPVRQSASRPDVPVLRSLGPRFEEDLHGRHAAVLLEVLDDKSANAATNIALAGHYGSGKSSVILGVQAGLAQRKINCVNLSLSSLGIDDTKRARIQEDGTLPPLTNLIQKEIVKQLLYRKAPADMPGSRYFRIDPFRPWPAAFGGAVVAVVFFVIAVLFGLVNRVEKVAPQALVGSRGWVPWAIVGGLGVFLGVVCFWGWRGLRSRVRVESVSAGGAAVTLSAKENSYFDEYLDEIVYFFQRTKTQVAIFEDLDRFRDPHIFETLRELNTVLNNSEQIGSRPVRFVYAVRDSIFEQLKVDAAPSGDADADVGAPGLHASARETAPSANRTKFFDLVVPMVPFITHRSSRDLLAAEFAESDERPSAALMNLVGGHLTDMRLIRNIRNEFEVYRVSILGDRGLKGLTADRLFAMMVYKNLHLEDFEAIRLGASKIDDAYRAFRDMVTYQTVRQAAVSKEARDRMASNALWDKHAKVAGERLQKVLPVLYRVTGRVSRRTVLYFQSQEYALSDLTSGDFWRSLHTTRQGVRFAHPGYPSVDLSFDDVIALVGDGAAALDDAVEVDVEGLRRTWRSALETKDFVAKATMAQLMARPDLVMPSGDDDYRSLDDIVAGLVSPVARDLLARGYIDENFTLYCSDYHGIAISVSAMNFILHCVQPDRADHRFRFDEPASIDSVETEMGARFLGGESVFNIEVFDHYLSTHSERLDTALDKLVTRAGTDTSFIDAYLTDGAFRDVFVGQLAPRWKGVFVHLVENAPIDLAAAVALIDATVQNADLDVAYVSSDRVAEFFAEHYAEMRAFAGIVETSTAADVVALVSRFGTQVRDLTVLGDAQREAVVAACLYPVTRANLFAALGEGTPLALDVLKATNLTVYRHVLDNLDSYLHAREEDDVTVDASEEFVAVLNDVAGAAEPAVLAIAEGASQACQVADLEELDATAWTAVVTASRLAPTVRNVSQFVDKLGVSEALANALNSVDLTDAEEVEVESRYNLGYALAHAENLNPAARVRLVKQLKLPGALDPERLTVGLKLLPALLAAKLVPDTAATYARLSGSPFEIREEYFAASKHLASYVRDLPLSSDDLPKIMRSTRVTPDVKRTITDDPEYVHGRLSQQGAIAICEWAAKGNNISIELLVKLSEAGAPAEHILRLLQPRLRYIDLSVLNRILLALGDDYEQLTRRGHHRPRLKERDGTEELLEELKRRGQVSSYRPSKVGGIRVNMRR
ncbi:hypothetical protein [Micromonospora sp. C95]|uniref:YobI family P-loop NTPase n=1 Tax=Micromonospora sp. C95 TaxID=2824882 RepID=UPI001B35BCA9|nr:hypothetical protein [Micromonospora sp. C95]MBQ1022852.1 hypothetical protein [Micromonospora sp. C95]